MSVSYDDQRLWQNIDEKLKDDLIIRTIGNLECSICSEVMHAPFLAPCGHSFCYGCLNAWFQTKVNCPTCRTTLDEPPVLNIQLKEISKSITDIIIDTMEDEKFQNDLRSARKQALDEFEQNNRAKNLFGDAFKNAATLIDRSDGVPRCGNCHWEAHGSVCLNCGVHFRVPRGDSYYDSEDGDAYNEDEDEVELYGVDNANYDSEDSFVDTRDITMINRDRHREENDSLLSSGSESEEWSGFTGRGAEEREFDNYGQTYRDDDSELNNDSAHTVDSGDDMEDAVERLHEQDVRNYIDDDVSVGSVRSWSDDEPDSDADVRVGRRQRRVIQVDSD